MYTNTHIRSKQGGLTADLNFAITSSKRCSSPLSDSSAAWSKQMHVTRHTSHVTSHTLINGSYTTPHKSPAASEQSPISSQAPHNCAAKPATTVTSSKNASSQAATHALHATRITTQVQAGEYTRTHAKSHTKHMQIHPPYSPLCTHSRIHKHTHTHTHMNTHTHSHARTHTHTQTHKHKHTQHTRSLSFITRRARCTSSDVGSKASAVAVVNALQANSGFCAGVSARARYLKGVRLNT